MTWDKGKPIVKQQCPLQYTSIVKVNIHTHIFLLNIHVIPLINEYGQSRAIPYFFVVTPFSPMSFSSVAVMFRNSLQVFHNIIEKYI